MGTNESYSPECVAKLSEKGYEQRSDRGFGRCRETKMGRKVAFRCSLRLHSRLLRPFRIVSEGEFSEVRLQDRAYRTCSESREDGF
jgi:hypothetical protein